MEMKTDHLINIRENEENIWKEPVLFFVNDDNSDNENENDNFRDCYEEEQKKLQIEANLALTLFIFLTFSYLAIFIWTIFYVIKYS